MKYTWGSILRFPRSSHWWKPLENLKALFKLGFISSCKTLNIVNASSSNTITRKSFETCQIYNTESPWKVITVAARHLQISPQALYTFEVSKYWMNKFLPWHWNPCFPKPLKDKSKCSLKKLYNHNLFKHLHLIAKSLCDLIVASCMTNFLFPVLLYTLVLSYNNDKFIFLHFHFTLHFYTLYFGKSIKLWLKTKWAPTETAFLPILGSFGVNWVYIWCP